MRNNYNRQVGYGDDPAATTSFDNCGTAIAAWRGPAYIFNNRMTAVKNGILCADVSSREISIDNNRIDAVNRGISLNNNDYASKVTVLSNHVTVNSPNATGISVYDNANAPATRHYDIICNQVVVTDGDCGIKINAGNSIYVASNAVTLNSANSSSTGIALLGSKRCGLLENNVLGNSTSRHTAYLASAAPFNSMINNNADETNIGFDFWNICTDNIFKGNSMNEHNMGLHLNTSGVMGVQPSSNPAHNNGNIWARYAGGANPTWVGAVNDNTGSGGNGWQDSKFYTHITAPPDIYYPNYSAAGAWFQWVPGTPFSATYPSICTPYAQDADDNSAMRLDTMIVQDSIYAFDFQPEARYSAKRDVHEKVNSNDTLKNDNGLFENFYDSLNSTSAGALSNLQFLMKQELPFMQDIQLLDSLINQKLDSLVILDSLININSTTALVNIKVNLLVSLNGVINQLGLTQDSLRLNLDAKHDNAKNTNTNIAYTNNIEQTEQEVNDFHFTYHNMALSAIDTNRIITLQYIAQLCPFAYGTSVYKARSELARLGIIVSLDDKANCATLGYLRQQQSSSDLVNNNFTIVAVPNPANASVTINFTNAVLSGSMIEVRNLLGEKILVKEITEKSNVVIFDLSALTPSVYLIRVVLPDNSCYQTKLTVIK